MHWAALGKAKAGRVGVAAGLLGGLLLGACSFNLPARCDGTSCTTSDGGTPADMAPALPDPNLAGPYMVAMAPVDASQLPSLKSGTLYLPSDNGTSLSTKAATYPLVLLAPAQNQDPQQLGDYAQRLASHGIVTALWQATLEGDHQSYRSVGMNLLGSLIAGQQPIVAGHLDSTHVGLAGYDLGAAISMAIANQNQLQTPPLPQSVRGLVMIDPKIVDPLNNPIDFMAEMAMLKLGDAQAVLMLGEQKSNASMDFLMPCTSTETNYLKFYMSSPSPTIALDYTNAAHGEFTETYPDPACLSGMDKRVMAPADTKRLAIKYLTAYFQWTLLGRATGKDYLTGASFTADAKQYTLTVTQK